MTGLELSFHHRRGTFGLDVTQTLPATGLTAVFGPSGAGKSSLLRAIAGFDRTGGRISLNGEVWEDGRFFLPPHRRRVGFVFQDPRLFAHLDVAGNLLYAARRGGGVQALNQMVRDFQLELLLHRRPTALSGGEAQRVALARALLSAPQLLLMDEPLSALDASRRAEILPHIERLRDQAGLPILYVSHSLAEVARLANRVLALADGKVVGFGPTGSVLADAEAAAAFGGEEPGSLIEARHEAIEPDGLSRVAFAGGSLLVPALTAHRIGQPLRLLVRARDVMVARTRPEGLSALNILPARVESLRDVGPSTTEITLTCGGTPIRARITRRSVAALGLEPGVECHAILKSVALAQE